MEIAKTSLGAENEHVTAALPEDGKSAPRGSERVSVIVADDEKLFLDLLVAVLSRSGNIDVVGAYADAEAAIEAARLRHPKVVILDIELRGRLNGIQAGLLIRKESPDTGVIWLSAYTRPYLPLSFQQQTTAGWGYLLKRSGTDAAVLSSAIDGVAKRLVVLDSQILDSMNRLRDAWIPSLTALQYDILALMAQGFGNAAVADSLGLPEKSVKAAINQIYRQFRLHGGVSVKHRRVEAVLSYLRGAGLALAGEAPLRAPGEPAAAAAHVNG
ncbi:MAG TPA: response regulator transcription factor [bacterium]|nr:response regulator transcription factor [bacterium]